MIIPEQSGASSSPYTVFLSQVASEGGVLLSRVFDVARNFMNNDVEKMSRSVARNQLGDCIRLLDLHAQGLCEQYPMALMAVFARHDASQSKLGEVSTKGLRMDQLALMDEAQVHERVAIARVLQQVMFATEQVLIDFNPYVCALQGLQQVSAVRNPLRPDSYVLALQELMAQKSLHAHVRSVWLEHMAAPLGEGLRDTYSRLLREMESKGVRPAAFVVSQKPGAESGNQQTSGAQDVPVAWTPQCHPFALTLDRLRRLMAKELDSAASMLPVYAPGVVVRGPSVSIKDSFAQQFDREFGDESRHVPSTAFDVTVPAAFEAVQEMQQAQQEQLLRRITRGPSAHLSVADALVVDLPLREEFVAQAKGVAQVLSLEVVALMIDNLVQDQRLLEPVRFVIARLEPALMRLVRVDVRFFSDKQHPARRLLQEIAEHGMAFADKDDPLFVAFLESLHRFVSPLSTLSIDSAEPFAAALASLTVAWQHCGIKERESSEVDEAKATLKLAEDRNLLASKMASDMRANDALQKVPQSVVDFLLGPWSQVMASAQLSNPEDVEDPGGYKDLMATLLWSAQPELACTNIGRLTKLVPPLVLSLREGLSLIDYPPTKTTLFFDELMNLYQQAFNMRHAPVVAPDTPKETVSLLGELEGWVAPGEAKASCLMDFPDDLDPPNDSSAKTPPVAEPQTVAEQDKVWDTLTPGCWVELRITQAWVRTQLTWISPQKTMYLFTNIQGATQSMTKRMLVRLSRAGAFKVLSKQPVVEDALDAVVHTAMINSLDARQE